MTMEGGTMADCIGIECTMRDKARAARVEVGLRRSRGDTLGAAEMTGRADAFAEAMRLVHNDAVRAVAVRS